MNCRHLLVAVQLQLIKFILIHFIPFIAFCFPVFSYTIYRCSVTTKLQQLQPMFNHDGSHMHKKKALTQNVNHLMVKKIYCCN